MNTKEMNDLRYTLCEELEKVARKKDIGPGDLELAHKLTDTIKNIDKIGCMEEYGGNSQMDDWAMDGYGNGASYANRGKHYVRGHYSRDPEDGYSGRGRYSREDGRGKMLDHLEMAMESAPEQDREDIKRFIYKIKNA